MTVAQAEHMRMSYVRVLVDFVGIRGLDASLGRETELGNHILDFKLLVVLQ